MAQGDAQREQVPPNGLQTLLGNAQSLADLLALFQGKPGGTTVETTQQGNADLAAILMQQVLESNQGLAAVTSGQRRAGLYDSTTNQMLTNDLLARASAEIAKANSPTVRTTQGPSVPAQLDPTKSALGVLGIQLGGKIIKDTDWNSLGQSVSNFFSAPDLGAGYEMESMYGGLDYIPGGEAPADFDFGTAFDFDYDVFADFAGTDFAADAVADLGYESFNELSDLDWASFDFMNGGRVPAKKRYASGGRVERDNNILSLYGSPEVAVDRITNRGRAIPTQRDRIRPAGSVGQLRIPRFRDPYQGSLYSSAQGRQNVALASVAANQIIPGQAIPIASYVGAADRLKRGDTRGGFGQAAGTYFGGALGGIFGGPAGAAAGSAVGGYLGGRYADSAADRMQNALGDVGGERAQAFYDPGGFLTADGANSESWRTTIKAHADPVGSTLSTFGLGGDHHRSTVGNIVDPLGLFADGGLVPGHDRKGKDDVPINVSGGEYIIPTGVVDAIGEEFFDELLRMFHKPIRG